MFENEDWNDDEDYLKEFKTDEVIKNFGNEKMKSISNFEVYTSVQNSNSNKNVTNADNKTIKKGIIEQENRHRGNLDLEIFYTNKATEINSDLSLKAVNRSVLRTTETINKCDINLKRKKNVAFFESTNDLNSTKKFCISPIKENLNHIYYNHQSLIITKDVNINSENSTLNSKQQLLLNLLKLPNKKSIRNSRTKYSVMRKFPGPAGLLPDNLNESEMIDLDSIHKNKYTRINNFDDVYSQNTKNIFTTGAWQLMMDDLPANFQLYEIADIKENALAFSNSYKKVPFLAGVIQHIDYKPNNPHILLKDFSGKINACIHHSICKLYPNALGTNVVILVKDVGLIVTSKKYVCVIISAKNLVSIYSDNVRLVETPYFEELVNYDCNLNNENRKIKSKLSEKRKTEHHSLFISNANEINDREEYIAMKICEDNSTSIKRESYVDHVLDLDLNQDDSWLGVHINDLNSFDSNKFSSSTPIYIANKNSENKSLSKSLHSFEQGNSKVMPITNSHKITIDNSLNVYNTSNYNRLSKIPMWKNGNINTKNKEISCNQNDSDDEILSQIDIDAIAGNYNK